jgi:hypothetical protein
MKPFLNILGGIVLIVLLFWIVYLTDFLLYFPIVFFGVFAIGLIYEIFKKKPKQQSSENKPKQNSDEMFICSKCNQMAKSADTYISFGKSYSDKIYVCRKCNTPPLISRFFKFFWSLINGCYQLILGILISYILLRALWGIFNAPSGF